MLQQQQKHHHPIHPHAFLNTTIDSHTIKLTSILGVGAYGIVYKATHLRTGELYAVKLLNHVNKQTEAEIHDFVSGHPNVLGLIKRIDQGRLTFLVLEYCPHSDLFAALTRKQQGQEEEQPEVIIGNNNLIRHIFTQLLDAVQHCHTLHVAHMDLKPENILIFPNHHVKLADFGLATTRAVSADFGCGSSFYFSPECHGGLLRNQQRIKGYSTQQNDVWSLGIILINLATGRNPWKKASPHDASFKAFCSQRHPGFFRLLLPSISSELESILDGIFCLDPSRRMSLPELRVRISQCHVFTYHPQLHHAIYPTPSSHILPHNKHHFAMTPPAESTETEPLWDHQELSTVMDDIQAYASSFSSTGTSEAPSTPDDYSQVASSAYYYPTIASV